MPSLKIYIQFNYDIFFMYKIYINLIYSYKKHTQTVQEKIKNSTFNTVYIFFNIFFLVAMYSPVYFYNLQ